MSQILARLKSTTQPQHDQLEAVSFAREIMSQKISRKEYIELLAKTAVIYQVLEPMVNEFINKTQDPALTPFISNRLSDVEKDLVNLTRRETEDNAGLSERKEIGNLSELIGILYVLEGARLGGKVIVKALRKNPTLADIKDFHFYQQTGIDIRQRWLNFRTLADNHLVKEQDQEKATLAARETFNYFYNVHKTLFQNNLYAPKCYFGIG